jgi:hypothetical protein
MWGMANGFIREKTSPTLELFAWRRDATADRLDDFEGIVLLDPTEVLHALSSRRAERVRVLLALEGHSSLYAANSLESVP